MRYLMIACAMILMNVQTDAQLFEIDGKAKVMVMDIENSCDSVVVRLGDGTLALRDVNTISGGGGSQTLSISNDNDTIFLTNGGFVELPENSGSQMLSISNDNDTIFLTNGGFVKLPPDQINDSDADSKNELQILSTNGDSIFIENGNYIVLPGLGNLHTLNISIQERINRGATPSQIYQSGFPLDSLYGKVYAGGYIYYLDAQDTLVGVVGMVAAMTDQDSSGTNTMTWGCYNSDPITKVTIGPSGPNADIGYGADNTFSIDTSACSVTGNAPVVCADLTLDGYTDWFLPSILELDEMYQKIGLGASVPNNNIGSFQSTNYWSSTPSDDFGTWKQDMGSGNISGTARTSQIRVRAVRAF